MVSVSKPKLAPNFLGTLPLFLELLHVMEIILANRDSQVGTRSRVLHQAESKTLLHKMVDILSSPVF